MEYILQINDKEVTICMKNRWIACLLALLLCVSPAWAASCGAQANGEEELKLSAEWLSEGNIRVTWNREACASVLAVVRLYRNGKLAACEWRRACEGGCTLAAGSRGGEYRVEVSACLSGGRATCAVTVGPAKEPAPTPAPTVTIAPTATPAATATDVPAAASLAEQVIWAVNRERAAQGLSALAEDEELTRAACVRAKEIVSLFSHTRPDGSSCFTVSERAYGENIAKGYATAEEVMAAWMRSDGHRENILRERFATIGVCAYRLGGVTYWVQLFGI